MRIAHIDLTRIICLVTALIALFCFSIPGDLSMTVRDNRVSLTALDVPLEKVLHELEEKSDLKFHYTFPASGLVTLDLDDVPVKRAVEILLVNASLSFDLNTGVKSAKIIISQTDHTQDQLLQAYSREPFHDLHRISTIALP